MPAIYYCDKCGKEAYGEDWDGQILCEYHRLIKRESELESEIEEEKKWLYDTHFKHLKEKMKKLRNVRIRIKEFTNKSEREE